MPTLVAKVDGKIYATWFISEDEAAELLQGAPWEEELSVRYDAEPLWTTLAREPLSFPGIVEELDHAGAIAPPF